MPHLTHGTSMRNTRDSESFVKLVWESLASKRKHLYISKDVTMNSSGIIMQRMESCTTTSTQDCMLFLTYIFQLVWGYSIPHECRLWSPCRVAVMFEVSGWRFGWYLFQYWTHNSQDLLNMRRFGYLLLTTVYPTFCTVWHGNQQWIAKHSSN